MWEMQLDRPRTPSLTTALYLLPDSVRSHVLLKGPQRRAKSPGQLLIHRSELSESLGSQETWLPPLGWEDPLEKGTATHSSILA